MDLQYKYYLYIIVFSYFMYMSWKYKYYNYKTRALFFLIIGILLYATVAASRDISYGYSAVRHIMTNIGGADTLTYKSQFEMAGMSLDYYWTFGYGEPGYKAVFWILNRISNDYRITLFIFHSVSFYLMATFLYKQKELKPSYIICLLFSYTLMDMFNLLRMGMAIPILLHAFESMKHKNMLKSFILIVIASSFHLSASIGICILLLILLDNNSNYNIKTMILVMGSLLSMLFAIITIFVTNFILPGTHYEAYLSDVHLSFGYLYIAFIFIISLSWQTKIKKNIENYRIYIYILLVAGLCIIGQMQFFMMYRVIDELLPMIYLYSWMLVGKCFVDKTGLSFFISATILVYLFYRIGMMFFLLVPELL